MQRKRKPYKEGDWFAVPLRNSGYALGRIARVGTRGGVLLGYFFDTHRQSVPVEEDIVSTNPANAVLISHFCDSGLITGEWPIVSQPEDWRRDEWPQPAFGHIDVVDPIKAFRREYDDNPSAQFVREVLISPEEAKQLPTDGLYGHIALQTKLTQLLST